MSNWTDEAVATLRRMWIEGAPATAIASEVGNNISRNAVIGKAHRLKLPFRKNNGARELPDTATKEQSETSSGLKENSEQGHTPPRRQPLPAVAQKSPAEPTKKPGTTRHQRRKQAKHRAELRAANRMRAQEAATEEARIAKDKRAQGRLQNEESRRAFNEKIKAKQAGRSIACNQLDLAGYDELRRKWLAAMLSLYRSEGRDTPHAADARHAIANIEEEWLRRAALPQGASGYFPWPSTEAPDGNGRFTTSTWKSEGMLAYLGYHVGTTSDLRADDRRLLLARLFEMSLPPLNGPSYLAAWDVPNTPGRLQKMAECIAAFTRNAKRKRNPVFHLAIEQWEEDLRFLYRVFYAGRFRFVWPQT